MLPVAMCLAAGCTGPQSMLDPHGPVAAGIALSWWIMFGSAVLILASLMALVLHAMSPRSAKRAPATVPFLAWAGVALPAVTLIALVIYATDLGRRITQPAADPLRIEVTGHRWWWEVRYPDDTGPEVITANELRLPTGVPVELTVTSADVIHSFWIPNLGGKIDMIPGRTTTLRLTAESPGRFNAQCSEFCGAQHARMGFIVIAEAAPQFEHWRNTRAGMATAADGPGLQRFMQLGCANCHTIAGTAATGTGGPVLTHLGDRPTVGGRAASNSPETLRRWLADHGQALKPGSLGPGMRVLDAADTEALARFLEQLR